MNLAELGAVFGAIGTLCALGALVFKTGVWHARVEQHLSDQDRRMDNLGEKIDKLERAVEARMAPRSRPLLASLLGVMFHDR